MKYLVSERHQRRAYLTSLGLVQGRYLQKYVGILMSMRHSAKRTSLLIKGDVLVLVVIWLRRTFSLGTVPSSMSYCLPGMRPKMIITASSASSSTLISTRCHGVPFTLTERPFEKTSDTIWGSEPEGSPSELSSSVESPSVASDCSTMAASADERSADERRNVTDTDVISRTVSESEGRQGRMECHWDKSFMLSFRIVCYSVDDGV